MPEKPTWHSPELAAAAAKLRSLGDLLDEAERAVGAVTSRLLAADANLVPPPAVKPAAAVAPPRCSPEQLTLLIGLIQSLHASPAKVKAELDRYRADCLADLTPGQAADLERRLRLWLAAMQRGAKQQ